MKKGIFATRITKNAASFASLLLVLALSAQSFALGSPALTTFTGNITTIPSTPYTVDVTKQSGGSSGPTAATGTISGTAVSGTISLTNVTQVTIISGSPYAGWGYTTADYSFSIGSGTYAGTHTGNIYSVFDNSGHVWSALEGNIHAVGLIDFTSSSTGTAYLTSINGVQESGTISMTIATPSNTTTSQYPSVQIYVTSPISSNLTCTGTFAGSVSPSASVVYLPFLDEGINFGTYSSISLGTYSFHTYLTGCNVSNACMPKGMSEGALFGTHTYTMNAAGTQITSGLVEHVIATVPTGASGTVVLNPAPGVTVTGTLPGGTVVTAVPALTGNQPASNFQIPGFVYNISATPPPPPATWPLQICLSYNPTNPPTTILHDVGGGNWQPLNYNTITFPGNNTICGDTYSLSPFAVGVPIFDTDPPASSASLPGGNYTGTQSITLSCNDAGSGCSQIFYTTDGSTPTTGSASFAGSSGLLSISATTTLKFFSKDNVGNIESPVRSVTYTINSSGGSGGTGGGTTKVPVFNGIWLMSGIFAGFGLLARRKF